MDNTEQKIKHLEMIENVISRMASNSSKLKEWTMMLVVAVCALATQGSERKFIYLSFVPIIGFWILDSYYLYKERKYCELYSRVSKSKEIDFCLKIEKEFDVFKGLWGMIKSMFSVSEMCFYPLILGVVLFLMKYLGV